MIVLGVILLVLALLVPGLSVLFWIGVALIIIGVVLMLMGSSGHAVGGRNHYW